MTTKPLYEAQLHFQYMRHLSRLQSITNQRSKRIIKRDTLQEMHRIRNRSIHFQQHEHIAALNTKNQKILNKLLDIRNKRGQSLSFLPVQNSKSIVRFDNPARKRRMRQIQQSNVELAQRLLARGDSQLGRQKQKKDIQEYEKVKRMMQSNKKKFSAKIIKDLQMNSKLVRSRVDSAGRQRILSQS